MKRSFYYSWAQLTRVPPLHSLCSVVLLCLQSWTRKQALTDEASILWDMHELCLLSCTLSAFPQVCFHILVCTRTFELKDWNCARVSFSTKHWAKWQARHVYNLLVSISYWIFICTSCAYCHAHCPHFLKSAFIYYSMYKNLWIKGLKLCTRRVFVPNIGQVYNLMVSIFYWIFIRTNCAYYHARTLSDFPQVCFFIYVIPRT